MSYVCLHCGKEAKSLDKFIRCQYCGYRVLSKKRSSLTKEVSTN